MQYKSLKHFYYTNPSEYEHEYTLRFNAPSTKHFNFHITEYNRKKSYPAFLCYTEEILQLVQKIYQEHIKLFHLKQSIPPAILTQFMLYSIMNEIHATNTIEGVRSTKRSIRNIINNTPIPNEFFHLKSIVDKYQKILLKEQIPFNTCQDIRFFYDNFALNEVISQNTEHAPDGIIFRKDSVDITNNYGKTIHQGVFPESKIIEAMQEALSILNDASTPLLIRISLFHYLFEYIHPFYDGNGRTGRFIISYYLTQEYDPLITLGISSTIERKKKIYYELFQTTDSELNRGDLTYFVLNFLEFILSSFKDTTTILKKKLLQYNKYHEKLTALNFKDKTLATIYNHLLQTTFFYADGATIAQLMNITHKSRATVQKYLDAMPIEHLLIAKQNKPYKYKLNMLMFK